MLGVLSFGLPRIVCYGSHDLVPLSFHRVRLEVCHLDSDGLDVRPAILLPISATFIGALAMPSCLDGKQQIGELL